MVNDVYFLIIIVYIDTHAHVYKVYIYQIVYVKNV